MYHCDMEMELINAEKKQVILEDGSQYFYTIRPVEITNILGTSVVILDEYFIANSAVEICKLYKTNEGNWYDVPEANYGVDKGVLLALKLKIDAQ